MVGLPGQTLRDLAGDVMFFRDLGADMIGMVGGRPGWGAAEGGAAMGPAGGSEGLFRLLCCCGRL